MSTCPPPAPNGLTDAERADLLASVEGLIIKSVWESGLPRSQHDDLKQECRLAVWKASAKFDAGRAKFSTFVCGVLQNVLVRERGEDAQRAAGRSTFSLDADDWSQDKQTLGVTDGGGPPDAVDEALAGLIRTGTELGFAALLDRLKPGHRRLVEFVVLDRLTVGQIAARLGQPLKAVRRNLRAAVEVLAAAGCVPAEVASECGLDAAELARAGDPVTASAEREARRSLVQEAGPDAAPRALAAALGVSEEAVRRDRQKLGLRKSPKPRPPKSPNPARAAALAALAERDAQIAAARAGGRTLAEVAAAFKVSLRTVARAANPVTAAAERAARRGTLPCLTSDS